MLRTSASVGMQWPPGDTVGAAARRRPRRTRPSRRMPVKLGGRVEMEGVESGEKKGRGYTHLTLVTPPPPSTVLPAIQLFWQLLLQEA